MNTLPTFSQQSSRVAVGMFFAFIKSVLVALIIIVGVLMVGQSRVAPVSVNLLTAYAVEGAAVLFKPVRPFFPQPYQPDFNTKQRGSYARH